jgi:opacity protein-like surface antigen
MKKLTFLLALIAITTMVASGASAGPLRAVGFEAGYVSPDLEGVQNVDGTWVAGVFMDFGLPATNLYVNPFVNYWNWSQGAGVNETSFSDWTIGANLKYTIPTSSVRVQPYIAAGAAAHMMNVSQESISLDEGDTKFGFQTGAGIKVGVSERASLLGSGWYHIVEDANHWSARAGLAFSL